MNLRAYQIKLGMSQSRLIRLSGVSRFKICTDELGDGTLTSAEEVCVRSALKAEATRLRNLANDLESLGGGNCE